MNADVEEIKSRLNIVEVLGAYIRLEKAGSNYRAVCPFHNEKTPSFMVSEEKQFWHCFGCQKGGDVFGFVMEIEGLGFREALVLLADKAGVRLKAYDQKKSETKNRTLEILELSTKWYEHQLWNGPGKEKILSYLTGRGIAEQSIKNFRLGYAPRGWRNMSAFLIKRGYKIEEIEKTGLLVKNFKSQIANDKEIQDSSYYDRFRDRIMFPIADYSGKILGFSARVAPGGDETQAKYINTPETEVYHKSRILYGIDRAKGEIKRNDFVLLVDGNLDVVAASQAQIENVVAVSGTALTLEQIQTIKRYCRKVKMFFDMDDAGQLAAQKSAKLALSAGLEVEIVSLPRGKDAAELAKDSPEELRKSVEKASSATEYFFSRFREENDPSRAEGKKKIVEEMKEFLLSLESEVEKSHWIKKISSDLGVGEAALTSELKKASLKSKREEKGAEKNKEESLARPEKKEVLEDELLGLILSFPLVWEKAQEKMKEIGSLSKDSLLIGALEKGPECAFDFQKFSKILEERADLERAGKVYSRKKYQIGLNGQLEEIFLKDPLGELEFFLRELKKEDRKEKLTKISLDIKKAKERVDQSAVDILTKESSDLSKELAELVG